jgi:lipopolysaccharide/colanic/teichoic acid biosynthesis glycosyltransferase
MAKDWLKRTLDLTLAFWILPLAACLGTLISIAIKIDTKGPVFFKQLRLGHHGKPFPMLKFRSMVPDAEFKGTGLFSYNDDPRITRVGKLLRATSLDELPQLLNVLVGQMSFVGPRPAVTYELGPYDELPERSKMRFTVKPGLTGLAQISGRNDLNWDEKICYDNEYIARYNRRGVLEDIRILVRTVIVVLTMKGVVESKENSNNA